jgi:hypothetical protein
MQSGEVPDFERKVISHVVYDKYTNGESGRSGMV